MYPYHGILEFKDDIELCELTLKADIYFKTAFIVVYEKSGTYPNSSQYASVDL